MTFSIITVTFNAVDTLGRTLRSVGEQTCRDMEHIIMDGGSGDGTVAVARNYQVGAEYDVTVVSECDGGLYDAMNKALALAKGDYVVFLNAGDKLHEAETLQKVKEALLRAAERELPGIVYGDTAIVDDEGKFLRLRRLRPPRRLTWRSFMHGMLVCHQSFYVRLEIAQNYDLGYRFSADFDWCIRCMKEGRRLGMKNVAVPEVLTDYLAEGMTTANHKASLRERMRIMARHYGWPATVAMHLWFVVRAVVKC